MKIINMHTLEENVKKEVVIKKTAAEKETQPMSRTESPDFKELLEETT